MNLKSLQAQRQAILKIAARHGASNVRFFGSIARREETVNSDVDFLVGIEKNRSLLARIALIQELEDFLGCKVDVAKLENLPETIRRHVLQEAISL